MTPGTITGHHRTPGGTDQTGTVTARPETDGGIVRDQTGHVVFSGAVTATFTGSWTLAGLLASDDTGLDPHGFTWSVVVNLQDAAPLVYRGVRVVAGQAVDVSTVGSLSPVAPSYATLVNDAAGYAATASQAAAVALAAQAAALAAVTSPGRVGPTGPQGPAGLQGVPGGQGIAGTAGAAGPKGDPGPVGPAGLTWRGPWSASVDYALNDTVAFQGSSWFASADPPVGDTPSDVSSFWWPLALHGAQGPAGTAGVTGGQGPPGATGSQGTQGIQGLKGDPGVAGPAGPQGPTGSQGPAGAVGATGAGGTAGAQGPQGATGATGAAAAVLPTLAGVIASDVSCAAAAVTTIMSVALPVGTHVLSVTMTLNTQGTPNVDVYTITGTAAATFAGPQGTTVKAANNSYLNLAFDVKIVVTTAGTVLIQLNNPAASNVQTVKALSVNANVPASGYFARQIA